MPRTKKQKLTPSDEVTQNFCFGCTPNRYRSSCKYIPVDGVTLEQLHKLYRKPKSGNNDKDDQKKDKEQSSNSNSEDEDSDEKYDHYNEDTYHLAWDTVVETFKNILGTYPKPIHGDVFDFGDYRCLGVYIVYEDKIEDEDGKKKSQLLLIKSQGEYGYSIPVEFSDAPVSFFDFYHIQEAWVDPNRLFPGTEYAAWVSLEVQERRQSPTYEGQCDFDRGPQKVNPEFPLNYAAFIEEQAVLGWLKGYLESDSNWVIWYNKRIKEMKQMNYAELIIVLHPFKLPKDVIAHIVKMLFSECFCKPVDIAKYKKMIEQHKQGDDDDEEDGPHVSKF